MNSIYWHDYETSGVSPQRDRPLQFAGRRTSETLEPLGDPLNITCQPASDGLPHPMATLITGISPRQALAQGDNEATFARRIHAEFSVAGTCGAGYNSIRFDDEFTRYLLFRNFYDPYQREYQNNNSRWDLIDVVRLCYALRPDGIQWPLRQDGAPSFRLEDLTAANDIDHADAHDALADVDATIALAQRLRQHQPRLFDYAFSQRRKAAAAAMLDLNQPNPVLHVSSRYPARRGCLAMVLPICVHPSNPNGVLVADLAQHPEDLLTLSAEEMADRIFTPTIDLPEGVTRLSIKSVAINRAPVLAPLNVLKGVDLERIELDPDTCQAHLQEIEPHLASVAQRVRQVFAAPDRNARHSTAVADPDWSLYSGGFASNSDRQLFERVRRAKGGELSAFASAFDDPRFAQLLFQYQARNWPESLKPDDSERWLAHRRRRLLEGQPSALDQFEMDLAAARRHPKADGQQAILDELEGYVRELTADL